MDENVVEETSREETIKDANWFLGLVLYLFIVIRGNYLLYTVTDFTLFERTAVAFLVVLSILVWMKD